MTERITSRRRRARGEGSIYRTAEGRWRGAVMGTDPDTGRRRRYVVSGRSQAEARERLAELRRQLETSGRPTPKTTTAEYLAGWLAAEERRVRPATYRGRVQHVRDYLVPMLGAIPLAELRPSDVDRLLSTILARGRSGRTAAHVRATLRRALGDAQRDGLVARNVAALARPPRIEPRELHVLTAEQTRALLEDDRSDLSPLFALAATTGMREGELLGLTWADVEGLDGPTPTLTVRRSMARARGGGFALAEPKTSRSRRTLELGAIPARALRRQRARQAAWRLAAGALWQDQLGFVFTDSIGRPLAPWSVTKAFTATLRRLGLPHVRFHDLRHGAASLLLAQGTPLKVVSETLGHSSITITADTYAHLDREQRREAARAIDRALGGGAR